ncbi:MAG TPA: TPM domain-containing protein [Bryobacterales bacterium]|nr:TPM domain-containing protein [Bryobacterales bacterium]
MARRWSNPSWRQGAAVAGWLLLAVLARADVPKLQPRGYANDYSGVLSAAAIARADALGAEVERKTGAQMAVVLVKSLDGEPIEDYANTLARRWGIGHKDNRGVLLLLVTGERRNRIEVGYGLEPILPDGKVGGILRGLRPFLQQGNYDAAVLQALSQIAGVIAQEAGVTLDGKVWQRPPPIAEYERSPVNLPWWMILLGAAGIIWFFLKTGINPLFLLWGMGGWGGGSGRRGGGGGWGGGGFGGFGGGDFGGGGASSNW